MTLATKKITHVIYDMDGVLLDTEPFYTTVTQHIAQQYGKNFTWALKSQMMGRKQLDAAQILVSSLALPITAEEYLQQREPLLDALFLTAQPLRGAKALTQHLHQQGIPQAVATSTPKSKFALKTQAHQTWFNVFQAIITGDNPVVKKGKPAPDIFLAAAHALNADPAHCLVFEDALVGVEAAKAAGMSVVAIPPAELDKAQFAKADAVLNAMDEFTPESWGLPAF
ncbi:haloacid dehalogenase superfamily protein, subfamily IA, variant 3 with third motif having DD or ED [Beggiatoa alba B18LD]|uniref:Haloacid dehalogenase superfamily protein, subfamily IA, variant 3 with third motif having DD or ED n=1 Tax=Beggiatoa alba B18LD TaxID=395493 RepID=I3CHG0_9GAMM|nr:HAD-IA family hydrolase [Beggiatoa alba]EIJ43053.1 haloacid dehalogenase superfamily protein, subfamily IA, variant 3 with third motif having DD or ED [Beggiatoa alba B18LD]